jgi:hypothetical protein
MALSPAKKQARYRARQRALMQSQPDGGERALLEEAARCEQLSAEQRVALADRLAELANRHLWRAQKLAGLLYEQVMSLNASRPQQTYR